jgi:hypothetical protein
MDVSPVLVTRSNAVAHYARLAATGIGRWIRSNQVLGLSAERWAAVVALERALAADELVRCAGTQFDPQCVQALRVVAQPGPVTSLSGSRQTSSLPSSA